MPVHAGACRCMPVHAGACRCAVRTQLLRRKTQQNFGSNKVQPTRSSRSPGSSQSNKFGLRVRIYSLKNRLKRPPWLSELPACQNRRCIVLSHVCFKRPTLLMSGENWPPKNAYTLSRWQLTSSCAHQLLGIIKGCHARQHLAL